jgi:protein TonB
MIISLGLHGTAIFLVFALSSSLAQQNKPVVIDFSLIEPSGPPAPPSNAPQKKDEKPVIAKAVPVPSPPKHKSAPPQPASEPEGTIPVAAAPRASLPAAPEQSSSAATNGVPGGTGTPGSSQSAGNGTGDSAEKLASKYRAEHFAYIKKIIERNLAYPQRAQRMGWSGRVVVSFDVAKNGHVVDIRVVKSTGHELLDTNLIETIRKVEPFPSPPISVTLNIPFIYEIR